MAGGSTETFYIEDIPQETNCVSLGHGDLPVLEHFSFTDYAYKSLTATLEALPNLLSPLPVENIAFKEIMPTVNHIQGTTRMGLSSADSVVDSDLVHHTYEILSSWGAPPSRRPEA
jgi:choline dehydrogenase-like flavoprotein